MLKMEGGVRPNNSERGRYATGRKGDREARGRVRVRVGVRVRVRVRLGLGQCQDWGHWSMS